MDVRRRLVSEISSSKHLYIFTQLSTTFTPITNFLQYSYWCGLMLDGYLLSPKLVITILQLRSKAPLLSNILCSTTAHAPFSEYLHGLAIRFAFAGHDFFITSVSNAPKVPAI